MPVSELVTENVFLESGSSAGSSTLKAYLTGSSGSDFTCKTLTITDTGHANNVVSQPIVDGNKQVQLALSASQTSDLNTVATCSRPDTPENDLTSPIFLDFVGKGIEVNFRRQLTVKVYHAFSFFQM